MDRETVRMILLAVGVIVIAGVYVWGQYKQVLLDFISRRGEYDELTNEEDAPAPEEKSDMERFEPAKREVMEAFNAAPAAKPAAPKPAPEQPKASAVGAPFLIQMSVVSIDEGYFNGEELRDALDELGLTYGDMGIYHRYDKSYKEPLFSIASMVEPGTFPIDDMENFECPGIVLFFQPSYAKDPLFVFDELVNTSHELAMRLDGVERDETKKLMTAEKIASLRERIEAAF